jgi:hypothetical protein
MHTGGDRVPLCGAVQRKADIMITDRFSRLFDRLVARWTRYQDVPRDPATVADLAVARMSLDDVRNEIARERALLVPARAPRVEAPRVAVSESDLRRLRVGAIGVDSTS